MKDQLTGQLKMLTPWRVLQEAKPSGRVYVRLQRCLLVMTMHCTHSFSLSYVPSFSVRPEIRFRFRSIRSIFSDPVPVRFRPNTDRIDRI